MAAGQEMWRYVVSDEVAALELNVGHPSGPHEGPCRGPHRRRVPLKSVTLHVSWVTTDWFEEDDRPHVESRQLLQPCDVLPTGLCTEAPELCVLNPVIERTRSGDVLRGWEGTPADVYSRRDGDWEGADDLPYGVLARSLWAQPHQFEQPEAFWAAMEAVFHLWRAQADVWWRAQGAWRQCEVCGGTGTVRAAEGAGVGTP